MQFLIYCEYFIQLYFREIFFLYSISRPRTVVNISKLDQNYLWSYGLFKLVLATFQDFYYIKILF